MSAKQRVITIVTGLREDVESIREVERLLIDQRTHLSAADADPLESVNGKILRITSSLQDNSETRTKALESFGLSANEEGLEALCGKLPEKMKSEILDNYRNLEESLVRCKAVNDRNGELLVSQKALTDSFFGQDSKLYGEIG